MDQMCLTAEPHESPHSPSLALFLLPSRPTIAGTLGVWLQETAVVIWVNSSALSPKPATIILPDFAASKAETRRVLSTFCYHSGKKKNVYLISANISSF